MNDTFLLDTHVLLWFMSGAEQISSQSKRLILDNNNRCFISIASLWEMAIKIKIGKLNLSFELKELATHLLNNQFEMLPISFEHVLGTMNLEDHHRDPFDRILIAQAKFENLTIISKDANFLKYADVQVIW